MLEGLKTTQNNACGPGNTLEPESAHYEAAFISSACANMFLFVEGITCKGNRWAVLTATQRMRIDQSNKLNPESALYEAAFMNYSCQYVPNGRGHNS